MNFVKSFEMLGINAMQIPCIQGKGSSTTTTEGEVGSLYMNIDDGMLYKCVEANNGYYVWLPLDGGGGGIAEETDPTVPSWAKEPTKPTYNYSEIQNKPTLGALSAKDFLSYDEVENRLTLGTTATTAYKGSSGKANEEAIAGLQESKQDKLSFDGTYNAITNKAATVKTVTDKIAEVVADAPESFNTLSEIATWIAEHPESVAEINAKIAQNAENIAKKQDKLTAGDNITIDEDGKISASGGLSQSEVDGIAATKASEALGEAKAYTDGKSVDGVGASVDENNELTIEIKDKAGNVIATTKVALPSGGGGETPDLTEGVTQVLTNYQGTPWTDEQKDAARELLGALPKLYDPNRSEVIITVNKSGKPSTTPIATAVVGSAVVVRAGSGNISVPDTPNSPEAATSKKYVDGLIAQLKADNNLV